MSGEDKHVTSGVCGGGSEGLGLEQAEAGSSAGDTRGTYRVKCVLSSSTAPTRDEWRLAADRLLMEEDHKDLFEIAKLSYGGRGNLLDAVAKLCAASISHYLHSTGEGTGKPERMLLPHLAAAMLYDQILREFVKYPEDPTGRDVEGTVCASIDAHRDAVHMLARDGLGHPSDPDRYVIAHGALLQLAGAMHVGDRLLFCVECQSGLEQEERC